MSCLICLALHPYTRDSALPCATAAVLLQYRSVPLDTELKREENNDNFVIAKSK